MADIRIKDLTTTASSSASDDFIAVDGTTNGTRKLNAFSPTFGGNATVTGTLTVNSTITGASSIASVNSSAANGSEFTAFNAQIGTDASLGACRVAIGALPSATFGTRYGYLACYDNGDYRKLYLGGSPGIAATGGQILIPATIASTTTSSGALVVGNGTSGGLGVGGAINAGSYVRSINSAAANGSAFDAFRAEIGADGTLGALEIKTGGLPSATAATRYGYILAGDSGANRKFYVGGTPAGGAQVLIPATDASTSTSSGALVVSGGVGVAGAMYIGGLIESSSGSGIRIRTASGTASKFSTIQTGWVTWEMQNKASSTNLSITADGSTDALTLTNSGNAVVGGSIQTAAPSGGTAAAWKLGTVASVSPTSPNRTIEVDIGGTIYYIAAKTTNN